MSKKKISKKIKAPLKIKRVSDQAAEDSKVLGIEAVTDESGTVKMRSIDDNTSDSSENKGAKIVAVINKETGVLTMEIKED